MKIRYFKSRAARRIRRKQAKVVRRQEYRKRVGKWHEKFAWLPIKISTPDDDNEHSTIVWFETIMQKGNVVDSYGRHTPRFNKTVWIRYPEKEYFKKKLDGTLEPEEEFLDFAHDGTETNMSYQGSAAVGATMPVKGYIKKGGPSAGPAGPAGPLK